MEEYTEEIKYMGQKIQSFRKEHGYTQEQFAKMIERTTQHLSKIERGEKTPSLNLLFTICQKLNIGPAELFKDSLGSGKEQIKKIKNRMNYILSSCSVKKANLIFKVARQIQSSD